MINNYFLGLFATDGSLREYKWKSEDKTTYNVYLEMKDVDIIEAVADYYDIDVRSRTRTINNKVHTFYKVELGKNNSSMYSKYLKDNKQKLYEYFITLSNQEQNQFMRGAFDGDGGVCKKNKGLRCYYCANSKDGLDKIYEYWFNKNEITYSKYYDKRGSGAYNYNIGNQKEIQKFVDLIYLNSEIKLKRKYNIFKENGFLSTEK